MKPRSGRGGLADACVGVLSNREDGIKGEEKYSREEAQVLGEVERARVAGTDAPARPPFGWVRNAAAGCAATNLDGG